MRKLLRAVLAAVAVGAGIGLIARLGMALVAIAAGDASQFSVAGTATIVTIYSVGMLPAALAAAFTRGWPRWLACAGGGLFLLIPAVGVASEEIGDGAGLSAVRLAVVGVLSLVVFATIPLGQLMTLRLVDRLEGQPETSSVDPVAAPA